MAAEIAFDESELFAPGVLPTLKTASEEIAWLVGRGYPADGAMRFVSEHHRLSHALRSAVERGSCSEAAYKRRVARELEPEDVQGRVLRVNAESVLAAAEGLLGAGVVVQSLDGSLSRPSWRRGSYEPGAKGAAAVAAIAKSLKPLKPKSLRVFASARLADFVQRELAAAKGLTIELRVLEEDPDRPGPKSQTAAPAAKAPAAVAWSIPPEPGAVGIARLRGAQGLVTADPELIDACESWYNLLSRMPRDGARVLALL